MKAYYIKRITPNTGMVMRYQFDCTSTAVTDELPFRACKEYLQQNQQDLKVYKIASTERRKNGKRRLYQTICAKDDSEAVSIYKRLSQTFDVGKTYELLTGDWKHIL